jgi:hypothetical protein
MTAHPELYALEVAQKWILPDGQTYREIISIGRQASPAATVRFRSASGERGVTVSNFYRWIDICGARVD